MLHLTDEQEELLLVTLDEMREQFVYIKNRLESIGNKLDLYGERQNQIIGLMQK